MGGCCTCPEPDDAYEMEVVVRPEIFYRRHACPAAEPSRCPICQPHKFHQMCCICGSEPRVEGLCTDVCDHVFCLRCIDRYIRRNFFPPPDDSMMCPGAGCHRHFRQLDFLND